LGVESDDQYYWSDEMRKRELRFSKEARAQVQMLARMMAQCAALAIFAIGCRVAPAVHNPAPLAVNVIKITACSDPVEELAKCTSTKEVVQNFPGNPFRVTPNTRLFIQTPGQPATDLGKLHAELSKESAGHVSYETATWSPGFDLRAQVGPETFRLDVKQDVKDVAHDDDVRLTIQSGAVKGQYYFVYEISHEWSGISSPVLYNANARNHGLQFSNFAPSTASGIRWNHSDGSTFPYVALNGLLTMSAIPGAKAGDPTTYSGALGLLLDMGGYVQVGWAYSFVSSSGNAVVGVRPEVLCRLLANCGK
jgi:hypothetical protein